LIVAGLLAAAMSALSSGMSAITSVITSGFQERLSTARIFKTPLLLERLIGITVGAVGVSLAIAITFGMRGNDWNLVELSGRVVNLFVGPLAVLFFAGILLRRATSASVVFGFIFSTGVSIYISYSKQLFGLQSVSFTWVIPASFVAGFVATALASYFVKAPPKMVSLSQDGPRLAGHSPGSTTE
jgi:solute:Na+ symporter, SSS family